MELLRALEIIRDAPDESLCAYALPTVSMMSVVRERLRKLLPGAPVSHVSPDVDAEPYNVRGNSQQSLNRWNLQLDVQASSRTSPRDLHPPAVIYNEPAVTQPSSVIEYSPPASPVTTSPQHQDEPAISNSPPASPVTTSPQHQDEPATPRPQNSGSKKGNTTPTDNVNFRRVLEGIKRQLRNILSARANSTTVITSRKRTSEDIRLDDIRVVTGDKENNISRRFRRVLALRSLALEYTTHQEQTGILPTRLNYLCEHIRVRSEDPISQPSSARQLYNTAVWLGLKHLAIEEALTKHANKQNLSCKSISLFMALNVTSFEKVPFYLIPDLIEHIGSLKISLQGTPQPLLPILNDLTPWFNNLQRMYDLAVSTDACDHSNHKRPRTEAPDELRGNTSSASAQEISNQDQSLANLPTTFMLPENPPPEGPSPERVSREHEPIVAELRMERGSPDTIDQILEQSLAFYGTETFSPMFHMENMACMSR